MNPHLDEVIRFLDRFDLSNQETLEDIGQVSNVELIVEIHCSLTEIFLNFTVKSQCSLNDGHNLLLYCSLKLREMLTNESVVDGKQRCLLREWNCECPEMALESRIDLERTSCGVHASCVQGILDILESKLSSIIPVIIILVLSQKRDSSLSIVRIKGWHI